MSLDPYASTPAIVVSDLGMSRYDSLVQTSQVGTITYMAPEVMTSSIYGTAADIFSYAVCGWELVTRSIPYDRERYEPARTQFFGSRQKENRARFKAAHCS